MSDINVTVHSGRLATEPELIYLPSGVAKARFRLAVGKTFTKDGEKHERTVFIEVNAWRSTAEFAKKYLVKGGRIIVKGELGERSWDGADGKKHTIHFIDAQDISFADSKRPTNETETETEDIPKRPF
jgi:single-strand DNA-binding protein